MAKMAFLAYLLTQFADAVMKIIIIENRND